jgi:outer membrane protein assembly factor BamB/predicted Ser/Thr protein kinase
MHGEYIQQVLPQVGRYEIDAELGRGGMGIVYRAYEPALERTVALKVLSPDLADQPGVVARLRREAISAARLRHPHIALLYEFGEADGMPFLAMEYVPGASLRQLLQAGSLPAERALRLLSQIGEALDYAHAMGIVHRDVKPSNILVAPDDHAVLIDFGLAEMAESSLLTTDGAVLGTPHYMAPEQADGRGAGPGSDQYALAAVAYEMLTDVPPFHGRSTMAVVYAHIYELPPLPNERRPALPSAVNPVLLRALAKAPDERYPSLAAFVADLRQALDAPVQRRRPARRWRWLDVAGGLALVLLVLLALLLRGNTSNDAQPAGAGTMARSGVPLPQRIVWRHGLRLNGESAPVSLDDTLVVDTLDGSLIALSADTGEVRWHSKRVGARETMFGAPGAGSGLVFVGTLDGEVLGLSLASGGLIWRSSVQGTVQAAPLLDHDRLVVTTAKGYLYVLRAGSGQVIWGRPLQLGLREPTVGAGQIVVSAGTLLSALDMGSGTANWEFQAASTITTRPATFGNLVLVGTERGVLHALRASDGLEQWRTQLNGALSAAPAVSADAIFIVDRSGGLTALSADAKRVLWHFAAGAAINATPLLADGKLFFGASNGVFYALDASDGRALARIQLGGSIDTSPALGAGLIYVRADQVYALGS